MNIYNIEINTLDGKRIDLGKFNINKTNLKDIKNKLEQIHGYDKDSISFIYMCEKETKISMDAFISEEISHHKDFGNQYIDHLKIREVLNHIDKYGIPEDSHIFTEIGAKKHSEKNKFKELMNYHYINPEHIEKMIKINGSISVMSSFAFFITIIAHLSIFSDQTKDERKYNQFFFIADPTFLGTAIITCLIDRYITKISKQFLEKAEELQNTLNKEPKTQLFYNQKTRVFLDAMEKKVEDRVFYAPPKKIMKIFKDIGQEIKQIDNEEKIIKENDPKNTDKKTKKSQEVLEVSLLGLDVL